MKVIHRIPTQQYGYIELEQTIPDTMQPNDARDDIRFFHDEMIKAMAEQPMNELPKKEYDAFLDMYLLGEHIHVETYNAMSPSQKDCVQTIKRALARIKGRETRLHKITE